MQPSGRTAAPAVQPANNPVPSAVNPENSALPASAIVEHLLLKTAPPGANLLQHALRTIRSQLGMEVAFVSEFTGGERLIHRVDVSPGTTSVKAGQRDPLEATYCQRIMDGRIPALLQDTSQSAEASNLPITRSWSIQSYLGVPIMRKSGDLFGTFCCFTSTADKTLNERDVQLMQLFATFLSGLLEDEITQDEQTRRRLHQINEVLAGDILQIAYQPIVNLVANRVVGYEALSRLPIKPVRPPDEWFRDAGTVGMQGKLEIHAIKTALLGMARIPEHAYLAVNVSPETVLSGELDSVLSSAPVHRLTLEITEHAHVHDYTALERALGGLRSRGVKVAVDDAGAGFASFRHILKLRPDIIKIDRSLIARIDKDLSARAMAAALIRFAEETRTSVVAEGVETEGELAVLRELKAEKAQGYLLGRPGPLP